MSRVCTANADKLDPEEEEKEGGKKKKKKEKKLKTRPEGERELHNNNTPQLRTRLLSQFRTADYVRTYNTQLSACRSAVCTANADKLDPGSAHEETHKHRLRVTRMNSVVVSEIRHCLHTDLLHQENVSGSDHRPADSRNAATDLEVGDLNDTEKERNNGTAQIARCRAVALKLPCTCTTCD